MTRADDWALGMTDADVDDFVVWYANDLMTRGAEIVSRNTAKTRSMAPVDGAEQRLRNRGHDMSSVHARRVRTS